MWLQVADAKQPDLGYLTDPKQNVVKDFFKFATRSGTSAGSVAGKDQSSPPGMLTIPSRHSSHRYSALGIYLEIVR